MSRIFHWISMYDNAGRLYVAFCCGWVVLWYWQMQKIPADLSNAVEKIHKGVV
jgi:hypothetical protein